MPKLRATIIDVGWGDSLLLESEDSAGVTHYGLIDSNDTSTLRSSHIFLKKFFERRNVTIPSTSRVFEWVLVTHAHADHGQGLKRTLKDYGTDRFWYPDPAKKPAFFADLVRYASKPQNSRVGQCDAIDTSKILPPFGNALMNVLWPTPSLRPSNENDNSVVLVITLAAASFVFTGDAEADGVWAKISNQIPGTTQFFKVPHHGSNNGTFDSSGGTPWLNQIPTGCKLAISSHVKPFNHPGPRVVNRLQQHGFIYRTDSHYHVTIETDGHKVDVTYSHV
jgi:beta-lactamase superfamily II metal-dependent hydrolase